MAVTVATRRLHRDSLGSVQEIFPGDVNWMIAGKGIVHSERETHEVRAQRHPLHGLQLWVALPPEHETVAPDFEHVNKSLLPTINRPGLMMGLIVGEAYDRSSPVRTFSPMFYLDVLAQPGAKLEHPNPKQEAALFVESGRIKIGDNEFAAGDFVLLDADDLEFESLEHSRLMLPGGEKFTRVPISTGILWLMSVARWMPRANAGTMVNSPGSREMTRNTYPCHDCC